MASQRRKIVVSLSTGLIVGVSMLLITGLIRLIAYGTFRPDWLYAALLAIAMGLVRYFARRPRQD